MQKSKLPYLTEMIWVHSSVIKLGKKFGAAFGGCEEIAHELLYRIDRRRGMEHNQTWEGKQENLQVAIPKEVRNLAFDMKFKKGEPSVRGKITPIGNS